MIGGSLKYYPNDDRQRSLDELPANVAEVLDSRGGFVLFDGGRAHVIALFVDSTRE